MIDTINTENINVDFILTEIYVRESLAELNLTNVVDKVVWKATLSRNGATSIAMGEVFLDMPETVDGFIRIAEVSEQQVLDWVFIKLGGPVFIEGLKQGHAPILAKLEYEAQLKRWTYPLVGQQAPVAEVLSTAEIDQMISNITNP